MFDTLRHLRIPLTKKDVGSRGTLMPAWQMALLSDAPRWAGATF